METRERVGCTPEKLREGTSEGHGRRGDQAKERTRDAQGARAWGRGTKETPGGSPGAGARKLGRGRREVTRDAWRGGQEGGTWWARGGGLRPGVSPSRCWKGGIPGFSPFWRLRGPRVLVPAPASRSPDWWKILTSTAVKAAAGFGAGAGGAVTQACGPALPSGLDRGSRGRTDWDAETGDGAAASLPGGGRQPTDLSHPSRLGGLGTGGGFFWEWVLFTS